MWSTIWYYTVLSVESALGVFGLRIIEEPRYAVIATLPAAVEVRQYDARPAAAVTVEKGGDAGRGEAFRLLFAYIAGANTSGSRLAMTAPVKVQEPTRLAMTAPVQVNETAGETRMLFFLPGAVSADAAPVPTDPRVKIVTQPPETVAVLRFSGTTRGVDEKRKALIETLAGTAWKPQGEPYFMGYDPPFTIPFLRRNEVAVAVAKAG
ncbi:MAG: heme-binding protein [Hyphomicrobiales bacterium]|nr:MAG: heme-binding protein [Hyphomicrobiales bacterium]